MNIKEETVKIFIKKLQDDHVLPDEFLTELEHAIMADEVDTNLLEKMLTSKKA